MTTCKQSPMFDKLSFVRYMKNIGRVYRKQASELVSICRTFGQAQEQTPAGAAKLRQAFEFVDDALKSAAEVGTKTSKEVDKKFGKAIDILSDYESKCHPRTPASDSGRAFTVHERMADAEKKDKTSSMILNRLKENFHPTEPEPITTIEFLIHKSLLDKSPTIVKQVLSKSTSLKEILWNFSRLKDKSKRLTLKHNPHFYKWLPTLPEAYGSRFRTEPIETFEHPKISVLTDNPGPTGRVFLETAQMTRAFGNVWAPNSSIIFKDVCGKLEGESIVGAAIQDIPNLWCIEEPPPSPTPRSALSPNWNSSSPTMTMTPTSPAAGVPIRDWREPIRRMLQSLNFNVNIRITAKPPSNTGPSCLAPPFSIPTAGCSGSSDNCPLPTALSQCPPPIKIQIPAPSTVPPSVLPHQRATTLVQNSSTIALPLTRAEIPAPQRARPRHDTSQNRGSQEATFPEGAPVRSRASIPEAPSSGLNVTIISPWEPWEVTSTSKTQAGGQVVVHVPQFADPDPEREDATGRAPHLLPLPVQARPVVPPPQTQPRKKNWFQKFIWDYKK